MDIQYNIAYIERYIMSWFQLRKFLKETGETKAELPQWEADLKLENFQGTLDEYSEMGKHCTFSYNISSDSVWLHHFICLRFSVSSVDGRDQ